MTLLDERRIVPMLAKTGDPFNSKEYYFEPKWDGLRCIAYIEKGEVAFQNRNLRLVTDSYPELTEIPRNVEAKSAILDGEIVVLENGLPSFESLQHRFGIDATARVNVLARKMPATYIAFDLLHLNGKDMINEPLTIRRERLAKMVRDGPHILLSQYVREKGKSYFRKAIQLGLEGIIAKKNNSGYQIGVRSDDWVKIKNVKTMDCVVAGYTRGAGRRASSFGALVLAAFDRQRNLIHLGNVGTGFTDARMETIMSILTPSKTTKKTIGGEVEAPSPITWVRPKLVAEIGYMSMTRDKKLRFPRFMKLRPDKSPAECVL